MLANIIIKWRCIDFRFKGQALKIAWTSAEHMKLVQRLAQVRSTICSTTACLYCLVFLPVFSCNLSAFDVVGLLNLGGKKILRSITFSLNLFLESCAQIIRPSRMGFRFWSSSAAGRRIATTCSQIRSYLVVRDSAVDCSNIIAADLCPSVSTLLCLATKHLIRVLTLRINTNNGLDNIARIAAQ